MTKALNWTPHVTKKVAAAKRLLITLRNAIGRLWGPSPRLTKWAYTGMVRPILLYCSHVWVRAAVDGGSWKTHFDRLNRMALTMLAPMRKSTPTAGLEVVAYIMPIDLCVLKEAALTSLRIEQVYKSQWDGLSTKNGRTELGKNSSVGHLKWIRTWCEKQGLTKNNLDGMIPEYSWEKHYQVDYKV